MSRFEYKKLNFPVGLTNSGYKSLVGYDVGLRIKILKSIKKTVNHSHFLVIRMTGQFT